MSELPLLGEGAGSFIIATVGEDVEKGDVLYLVDGPEGLTLTPYQQDFEAQMDAAEKVMKKYRNALHELAK